MTSDGFMLCYIISQPELSRCSVADLLVAASRALIPTSQRTAQIALPEIVVTAPSPIQRSGPPSATTGADRIAGHATDRHRPIRHRHRGAERRTSAAAAPRRSATCCSTRPGITGSSFAPGASSRPIIRGLDVNRVRIQENGIGANGASDLGEDHFVPVDPLTTDQVEVIRGPATLRFGSQAIGGVVETTNNRIPTMIPPRGFSTEFRGAANLGRQRPRRRGAARCRRRQFRAACRRLRPQDARLSRAALSLSERRPIRRRAERDAAGHFQRPAAEFERAQRRAVDRRLVHFQRRLCRPRRHAEQRALSHSRNRRRRPQYPHRRPSDQGADQGRMARTQFRRSTPSGSGAASPTTSTTRSGSPTTPICPATASGRPSPTRSRKAASRCNWRRSTCASPR